MTVPLGKGVFDPLAGCVEQIMCCVLFCPLDGRRGRFAGEYPTRYDRTPDIRVLLPRDF